MHFLAILALTVQLAITPTTGKAPLKIDATANISGPLNGYACLTVALADSPDQANTLSCAQIKTDGTKPFVQTYTTEGGAAGKKFVFKVLLTDDATKVVAESNSVTVSTK